MTKAIGSSLFPRGLTLKEKKQFMCDGMLQKLFDDYGLIEWTPEGELEWYTPNVRVLANWLGESLAMTVRIIMNICLRMLEGERVA